MTEEDKIREKVRRSYAELARSGAGCCSGGCCGTVGPEGASSAIGYSRAEMLAVPDGANLGLGCGNPQAIASLKSGETVLDLGAGAGFDCFLAASAVGEAGRVIGVDMTPEMLTKARENAVRGGYGNVEFRLGEIEALPVADASVDVILSNCVINLSPDKARVFREAHRVLRPGGRLAISDIVATAPLPEAVSRDLALYTGCIAGAAQVTEIEAMLFDAGFVDIRITAKENSADILRGWANAAGSTEPVERYVVSANIEAKKTRSGQGRGSGD